MLNGNVNIGMMGHVDSGKTSIAKTLSFTGGTACFDKSPQSQARGITLDLGFSTFKLPTSNRQVTIVDCPGHASLIRTILCGAHIIDLIVLVIDAAKGMQVQTAECLVIAEIMTKRLVILINKVDLWPQQERSAKLDAFSCKLRSFLKSGPFHDVPILPFSTISMDGVDSFKTAIEESITRFPIKRNLSESFVFSVDHCFQIKGQGTILTGTVLQGQVSVNDMIEIPNLKIARKIKSIQSFRESIKTISSGDRAGICVQTIDSTQIEREMICSASSPIPKASVLLLCAKKVKLYKDELKSKSKLHISILNESLLCKQLIFVKKTQYGYEYLEGCIAELTEEFKVIVELDRPVNVLPSAIVIGSKLDSDISLNKCRIAFHGVMESFSSSLDDYFIYRVKEKFGSIDRVVSKGRLIGKGLGFVQKYLGMQVSVIKRNDFALVGFAVLDSLFGTSGKFNLTLKEILQDPSEAKYLDLQLRYGQRMFNSKNNASFCIDNGGV